MDLIPRSDYEIDNDVVARDVWKLFVITDPTAVNPLMTAEEWDREDWPPAPDDSWEPPWYKEWPEILGNFRGELLAVEEVGYRLLTALIGRGLALGFVLESRDGVIVDGWKVYGPSFALSSILAGLISFEKYRATEDNPHGVAIGDIADEDFARYLRMAHAEGLLKLITGDLPS